MALKGILKDTSLNADDDAIRKEKDKFMLAVTVKLNSIFIDHKGGEGNCKNFGKFVNTLFDETDMLKTNEKNFLLEKVLSDFTKTTKYTKLISRDDRDDLNHLYGNVRRDIRDSDPFANFLEGVKLLNIYNNAKEGARRLSNPEAILEESLHCFENFAKDCEQYSLSNNISDSFNIKVLHKDLLNDRKDSPLLVTQDYINEVKKMLLASSFPAYTQGSDLIEKAKQDSDVEKYKDALTCFKNFKKVTESGSFDDEKFKKYSDNANLDQKINRLETLIDHKTNNKNRVSHADIELTEATEEKRPGGPSNH